VTPALMSASTTPGTCAVSGARKMAITFVAASWSGSGGRVGEVADCETSISD
jgi:hypothetical protein